MALEDAGHETEPAPYNVEIIDTPNGKIRLVYGLHPFDHPSSDLFREVEDVGGYAIELAGTDGTALNDIGQYVGQLTTLLNTAAREGKPVFLTDIGEESELAKLIYIAAAATVGVSIAEKAYSTLKKKDEDPTRRNVLGKIAGAGALTYLGTDVLANALSIAGNPKWDVTRYAAQAGQVMDPVSLHIVKLRNLIIADNLELVQSRYSEEFKEADLVGVYGAGHKALGDTIRMGHERRMEELRFILTHIPPLYGLTARGIATVARLQAVGAENPIWAAIDTFLNEDIYRIAREAGFRESRPTN